MANMCSSEPGHRAPVAIRGAPRAGSLSLALDSHWKLASASLGCTRRSIARSAIMDSTVMTMFIFPEPAGYTEPRVRAAVACRASLARGR